MIPPEVAGFAILVATAAMFLSKARQPR